MAKIRSSTLESGKRAHELHATGLTWQEVGMKLGRPYNTLYNHARKYEASLRVEVPTTPKREVTIKLKSNPLEFDDFGFRIYIEHIEGKSYEEIGKRVKVKARAAEMMVRNYARSRGLPLR